MNQDADQKNHRSRRLNSLTNYHSKCSTISSIGLDLVQATSSQKLRPRTHHHSSLMGPLTDDPTLRQNPHALLHPSSPSIPSMDSPSDGKGTRAAAEMVLRCRTRGRGGIRSGTGGTILLVECTLKPMRYFAYSSKTLLEAWDLSPFPSWHI